ncbi:ExbD/TolR family protein [Falsihalocynthiibacter arcticus]|uniref:Biopolymer transporter ExbD n=1 Tax=Falsihalocynthiibacter arcticus TaxID=1579316 RepID=A0A126V0I3_9RHOB|nr:biopolymer transporter ExbD [Falsihalocynthiibacter arcticus]AML51800.1 hypothetical protein RC74_11445 [Falsihalocynthiibacter arcticus]
MLSQPLRRRKPEPTIALINVVFLMLIFFLIAGTIAPALAPDHQLVQTNNSANIPPPDAILIDVQGAMSLHGAPIEAPFSLDNLRAAISDEGALRIAPAQDLPATLLLRRVATLKTAGAEVIHLISERQAP